MKRPALTAAEREFRRVMAKMRRLTNGLYEVAYARAHHHEPNPTFPGLDIDAIHRRRK